MLSIYKNVEGGLETLETYVADALGLTLSKRCVGQCCRPNAG